MLRPVYMLYQFVSQSPVQGHILEFWSSRSVFPSPSPGLLSHPRSRHYRRNLEVVLLAIAPRQLAAHTSCRPLPGTMTGSDAAR